MGTRNKWARVSLQPFAMIVYDKRTILYVWNEVKNGQLWMKFSISTPWQMYGTHFSIQLYAIHKLFTSELCQNSANHFNLRFILTVWTGVFQPICILYISWIIICSSIAYQANKMILKVPEINYSFHRIYYLLRWLDDRVFVGLRPIPSVKVPLTQYFALADEKLVPS